ncbi:hypothetical protein NC797_07220 [Aquibacillus sp. 3ASR75-11]|uniref:Uncharacterized protein n=1 Tax=Terrihalobacillus insolitus TaxID=2950438 RepID=A0A9X4AN98_9BACI|nr:replication-relaxation family protein [Terrihalobacillus insolitus]MDC3424298.1 hypothetical protein [Terrihalobacillus insolitus]
MSVELAQNETLEYPFYYNKRGEVPFWDHPLITGYKFLPKGYYPYVTIEAVLSLYLKRRIDDTDIMIIKVLGDAICCNEDQLRRYLSSKISRSDVSQRLERFRKVGLVERWKVRIKSEEDSYKPPAPFVLGIAGYKLLKHYYNKDFFMDPNRWDTLGVGAVQRYVAVNELRCRLIEAKAARNWKWNALVSDNPRIKKPMGVAEIQTPRGNLNLLIERAQMSQDFVGYLKDKLNSWKHVCDEEGKIPVTDFANNMSPVVLFASTLSLAQKLQSDLLLDTFPFTIWVCVEEDMLEEGLDTAFYMPHKDGLKRVRMDFLMKK